MYAPCLVGDAGSFPRAREYFLYFPPIACLASVFPACAGVFHKEKRRCWRDYRLSRVRGSISHIVKTGYLVLLSFPRAREYFLPPRPNQPESDVFPACAGVFPGSGALLATGSRLSRVRGSISLPPVFFSQSAASFPRAREYFYSRYSRAACSKVFPACAGVFPRIPMVQLLTNSLSRVRGSISSS